MPGIFEAVGDPTRGRMIALAAAGEHTVGTIVDAPRRETVISQPDVSQHLRVLRRAEMVGARAEGKQRHHLSDEAGVDAALTRLIELADPTSPFAQPLDALATEVARGRRERRREQTNDALPRRRSHRGRSA